MKNDFAKIYKDGVTRADQQYNKSDWTVAEPKSDEGAQGEELKDAA